MNIAIVSSVSLNTPWAQITLPNRLEYCTRHEYTMIVNCETYKKALSRIHRLHDLLNQYDIVWTLDADCLITNLTKKIEEIEGLGEHVSICEEGLGPQAFINAGSIIWRSTESSHSLIDQIVKATNQWELLPYNIQDWLMLNYNRLSDILKIFPQRTFNSVHHGNQMIWKHGDFVYHPCGMKENDRCQALQRISRLIIK